LRFDKAQRDNDANVSLMNARAVPIAAWVFSRSSRSGAGRRSNRDAAACRAEPLADAARLYGAGACRHYRRRHRPDDHRLGRAGDVAARELDPRGHHLGEDRRHPATADQRHLRDRSQRTNRHGMEWGDEALLRLAHVAEPEPGPTRRRSRRDCSSGRRFWPAST